MVDVKISMAGRWSNYFSQMIPQSFLQTVQQLITVCGRHMANDSHTQHSQYLLSQLEATLLILEEGMQLLSSLPVYESEFMLLSRV